VKKRALDVVDGAVEGLGRRTVMDRDLAARHGAKYVHLVAFAIDVDRVREALDDEGEALPFGWEVLLTENWMVERIDPSDEKDRALLEEVCASSVAASLESDEELLGAQIPFAVYDAVARGAWPKELRSIFEKWKRGPDDLVRELARMREEPDVVTRFSKAALGADLVPPLAPPTLETLKNW
jgi:hypothetical protein